MPKVVPKQQDVPASRQGRRAINFYLPEPQWKDVQVLAVTHPRGKISIQALMEEATELLLAKYKRQRA